MTSEQQSSDGAPYAELLAFVAVAQALSFTRAGDRIGRDPTILSRRVRALERRLGVRLLERTTRTVALTEAGAIYLQRAQAIVEAIEDADREVADLGGGAPRGHLRLALPGAFGRLWLAPLLVEFLRAHPQVTVEADFSNRVVDLVDERFDLAVRIGALTDPRLVARKLAARRRVLCAAPAYLSRHGCPERPSDLGAHACLVYGVTAPTRWDLQGENGASAQVPVAGPVLTDDLETLTRAAVAGLGIILGSEWLLGPDLAAGRLRRVLPGWSVSDGGAIHLVSPSGTRHASKTRAFADFLTERLRDPPWLATPPA
jgi:DNA-binding transcriptional LysR family regulator